MDFWWLTPLTAAIMVGSYFIGFRGATGKRIKRIAKSWFAPIGRSMHAIGVRLRIAKPLSERNLLAELMNQRAELRRSDMNAWDAEFNALMPRDLGELKVLRTPTGLRYVPAGQQPPRDDYEVYTEVRPSKNGHPESCFGTVIIDEDATNVNDWTGVVQTVYMAHCDECGWEGILQGDDVPPQVQKYGIYNLSSENVKRMQKMLWNHGYRGPIDGVPGPQLQQAAKEYAWQKRKQQYYNEYRKRYGNP